MKFRTRLFLTSFIAGVGFRLGIPGIVDILQYAWERTVLCSKDAISPDFQGIITITGLAIFLAGLWFNYDFFIKGAKKGKKGIIVAVSGFLSGILMAGLFLLKVSLPIV